MYRFNGFMSSINATLGKMGLDPSGLCKKVSKSISSGFGEFCRSVSGVLQRFYPSDDVGVRGNVTWIVSDDSHTFRMSAHNEITDLGLAVLGTPGLAPTKYPELVNCDKLFVVTPAKRASNGVQFNWGTADSAFTQVLVNETLTLTPASTLAPLYDNSFNLKSDAILGYSSNRRSESGNVGYQNSLKTVSDMTSALSSTTSRMYPADCATGTVRGVLMMPGFADGKLLRGYSVYKGIDRFDPLNSDHSVKTQYMIKPGVTGLTGADEIIFGGYDTASKNLARYKFNFTTGKYSEVDISLKTIELPFAHTNQVVANGYLYYLSGSVIKRLNLTTHIATNVVTLGSSTSKSFFSDGTYGYYPYSTSELRRFSLTTGLVDTEYSLNVSAMQYKNIFGVSAFSFDNFGITNYKTHYMLVYRGSIDTSSTSTISESNDYSNIAGVEITDFTDLTSFATPINFFSACGSFNYADVTVSGVTKTYAFESVIFPTDEATDSLTTGSNTYTTDRKGVFINLASGNLISYQTPEGGSFEKSATTYLEVLYTYAVSRIE